jgi:hypothetical protein
MDKYYLCVFSSVTLEKTHIIILNKKNSMVDAKSLGEVNTSIETNSSNEVDDAAYFNPTYVRYLSGH